MFGLSFGELVVLLLVAVVVLGPKEMPRYLRKAGEMAGRLRRMAYDMRAKSGIDELLRSEGIGSDIAEIRRLATFARGEIGGIMSSVRSAANGAGLHDVSSSPYAQAPPSPPVSPNAAAAPLALPAATAVAMAPGLVPIDREREYPSGGADAYGALPETSNVYVGQLPASPLADDPLYAHGRAQGEDARTDDESARTAAAQP